MSLSSPTIMKSIRLSVAFLSCLGVCLSGLPALQGQLTAPTTVLEGSPGGTNHQFGTSVSLGSNTIAVGAPRANIDLSNQRAGTAYLYDRTTNNQTFNLFPSTRFAESRFGQSIGVGGDFAVVGAPGGAVFDTNGIIGRAYLFDTATGSQRAELTHGSSAANDLFGHSVAASGNLALIGAPGTTSNQGVAYIYNGTTGGNLFTLLNPTPTNGDYFGNAVATDGTWGLVGALQANEAHLFDMSNGQFVRTLLRDDNTTTFDQFGVSVDVDGNFAIVGAHQDNDNGNLSGSAYVFDTQTGNQLYKLTASDGTANDRFGVSVAVSGNFAIVGADEDDDGGSLAGSAYVYDLTDGSEVGKIALGAPFGGDQYGTSVDIDAFQALIGVPGRDLTGMSNAGIALTGTVPEPGLFGILGGLTALGWVLRRRLA